MVPSGFRIFPHTADLGIEVKAPNRPALFRLAARGMTSLAVDPKTVRPLEKIRIALSAETDEDLLVDWLSEVLFWLTARKTAFSRFRIVKLESGRLEAECRGEELDPKRHRVLREIKAATHHDLKIRKSKSGLSVRILFDI